MVQAPITEAEKPNQQKRRKLGIVGKIVPCLSCTVPKKIYASGMCRICYTAAHRDNRSPIKCASCGEMKLHQGRGLCAKCYAVAWRKTRPGYGRESEPRNRKRFLRDRYKISVEQYEEMLKNQDGHCACCSAITGNKKFKYLCVDHDHKTGAIRGLLCQHCNQALGQIGDSPDRAERLAAYLRFYSQKPSQVA